MNRKLLEKPILLILVILFIPLILWAGEATDRIKAAADNLKAILTDESLQSPDMSEKRDRMIMETVDRIFNWEEFSRRALAKNWNKRTAEEKKEFTSLFRQLIANAYIGKTTQYSGEKVVFLGEKTEGDYGTITGWFITSGGAQISVEYRIIRKGGSWWIYDVSVEGVSLVSNYRSQINAILTGSSYEELVRRLREKLNKSESLYLSPE